MTPEQGGWKIEYQTRTCPRPPNHLGTFEEHQGQQQQQCKLWTLLPRFLDLSVVSEYDFSSNFNQI